MKIPAEILAPYLTELVDRPQADNQKPEPVGPSARLGSTGTSLESDQPSGPMASYAIEDRRREPRKRKAKHHSGVERRKENRRKETRPILLDTRTSQNRRTAESSSSIDLKI